MPYLGVNNLSFPNMAFKKRSSQTAEAARQRLSGLKTLQADLDFGNGLNIARFEESIVELEAAVSAYNAKLSEADQLRNQMEAKEEAVQDFFKRMLGGVRVRYGYDSTEYEVAGGTRTSDRKKTTAKKTDGVV